MESTPLDIEVAVDPEMLGKVFEELVIERNDKGAFYTPRQCVSAMCRNTLKAYLSTKWEQTYEADPDEEVLAVKVEPKGQQDSVDAPFEAQEKEHQKYIREFVDGGIVQFNVEECKKIVQWLNKVTINDPAIGSGAFAVGMLHELVHLYRFIFPGAKQTAKSDYELKLQIIQNNIYGADIDEFAVNIAHLRLWLTLVVDYPTRFDSREQFEKEITKIPPLPNLFFKVRTGDSLLEKVGSVYFQSQQQELAAQSSEVLAIVKLLRQKKQDFFGHRKPNGTFIGTTDDEKIKLKQEVSDLEHDLLKTFLSLTARVKKNKSKNGKIIEKELFSEKDIREHKSVVWAVHYAEIFDESEGDENFGFDIIIANPPYGLKTEEGKELYHLGSKDSYGAFCAMALQKLKPNGILCFIQSDTWQTIKTHQELRRIILDAAKVIHVVMMPSWTFSATVNTSVLLLQKCSSAQRRRERQENMLYAVDLTNIPRDEDRVAEMLLNVQAYNGKQGDEFGVYSYPQGLIERNSNIPFFVGSPKLFGLMFDDEVNPEKREIGKSKIGIHKILLNGKTIELIRLGDISEIRVGLQTGDNEYYIRKQHGIRGGYEIIDENLVLTGQEISKLLEQEKQSGIDPKRHKEKYFLPYDKGGESDSDEGWMPNYFVPTGYFIGWSKESVNRLETLTVYARNIFYNSKHYDQKYSDEKIRQERMKEDRVTIASRFQNREHYFKQGITFSRTGIYAPTFRLGMGTVFDTEGSTIFLDHFNVLSLIALLSSKLVRSLLKIYIGHTVHTQVDELKELPIIFNIKEETLINLVTKIVDAQKKDPRYQYHLNEQLEIDKIVYEMYGLNEEDIKEVETWYKRRYPKLAKGQEK